MITHLDAANEILEASRKFFDDRSRWIPVFKRVEILREVAKRVKDNIDELALLIAKEGGKPLRDAKVEAARAAQTLLLSAEEAGKFHGEEVPLGGVEAGADRLAFTTREPIGVVVAISAFNHPLNLIAHQVGPAIAAGCAVLVKPALETPLSCVKLVSYFHEAGLPKEMLQAVVCDNKVSEQLAVSDQINFVSFIGSAKVGWAIRSKLAPGVRCSLEHGGAAPVFVDESADLEKAVPAIAKAAFYHSGQVCVSTQRIFVHKSIAQAFIEKLKTVVDALKVGDPTQEDTDIGPTIRPAELERINDWVAEAIVGGAKLVVGGKILPNQCYAPTIITGVPMTCHLMKEEVFGPVVAVAEFSELASAIKLSNAVPWAFHAAIFTNNLNSALSAARLLNASGVMINDHTAFRVDSMPFGGRGPSGLGTGGVSHSVKELTQEKLVVFKY